MSAILGVGGTALSHRALGIILCAPCTPPPPALDPPLPVALIRDAFANIPPHTHTNTLSFCLGLHPFSPPLLPPSPSLDVIQNEVTNIPPRAPPCPPPLSASSILRCEAALIQNEVTNIFQDDFSTLAEEDAGGGTRKESNIAE